MSAVLSDDFCVAPVATHHTWQATLMTRSQQFNGYSEVCCIRVGTHLLVPASASVHFEVPACTRTPSQWLVVVGTFSNQVILGKRRTSSDNGADGQQHCSCRTAIELVELRASDRCMIIFS